MDLEKQQRFSRSRLIPLVLMVPVAVAVVSATAQCQDDENRLAVVRKNATSIPPVTKPATAAEARKQYIALSKEGSKYLGARLYTKADITLRKALGYAEIPGASSIPERADLMYGIANATKLPEPFASDAEQKKAEQAINDKSLIWSSKIVDLHKGHPEIHTFVLACAYFNIGKVLIDRNRKDEAIRSFDKAIEELKQTKFKDQQLARWYTMISESYDKHGLKDKAKEISSLGLQEAVSDPYTFRDGITTALKQDEKDQKFERARQIFDTDTEKLAERILGKTPTHEYATSYIFLSDCLNDTGIDALSSKAPDKAIAYLQQALLIRDKLAELKFEYVRKNPQLDTATTGALLGRAFVEANKPKEALEILNTAAVKASPVHSYDWLPAFIADAKLRAAKQLNDTEQINKLTSSAYKLFPEHTFDEVDKWVLCLQAGQRLERESCWAEWSSEDQAALYEKASKATERFGDDDIRHRMCVIEQWFSLSQTFSGENLPKLQTAVRRLVELKPPYTETAIAVIEERSKLMNSDEATEWDKFKYEFMSNVLDKKSDKYKLLFAEYVKKILMHNYDDMKGRELEPLVSEVERVFGPGDTTTLETLRLVAAYYMDRDKPYDASQLLKKYIDGMRVNGEVKKDVMAKALKDYAEALAQTNDGEGAEKAMKEARALTGEPEPTPPRKLRPEEIEID